MLLQVELALHKVMKQTSLGQPLPSTNPSKLPPSIATIPFFSQNLFSMLTPHNSKVKRIDNSLRIWERYIL